MPTDSVDRRKILAAMGALGVSVPGVASAEHNDTGCDACGDGKEKKDKHDGKTEVCTFPCNKPKPRPERGHDHKWWWDGVITIHNCSNCVRDIQIEVSECIGAEPELSDHSIEQLPSGGRVEVAGGERRSVWFRGTITNLQMEAGDLNVGVSMRSEHLNNASMCEQ